MKKIIISIAIVLIGLISWFAWPGLSDGFLQSSVDTAIEQDGIPQWTGEPYVALNGDEPYFTNKEMEDEYFQEFSELDGRERCGEAVACVDREHMPEGEREGIGMIKPSGWQLSKYEFIGNGGYLFNRCHLIGWQLTGVNAEERNLITGTRYFNVEGMLPFENMVADYVNETDNHVMYRVTPVYKGKELVARGVIMEAESVEDNGEGLSFNVFVFNVQPGVEIDYSNGENCLADDSDKLISQYYETEIDTHHNTASQPIDVSKYDYILNTNSMKFHYPDCGSVSDMSEHNKQGYNGSRDSLIKRGYDPCGSCRP